MISLNAYKLAVKKTLKACDVKTSKEFLCNFDLLKFEKKSCDLHEIFFKEIRAHIKSINIFYILTDTSVKMHWMGHKEKELRHKLSKRVLDFDDILNKLNNSFPMICVWRSKDFLKANDINCFVDSCTPLPSEAWDEIKKCLLKFFSQVIVATLYISTADIFIKLLDYRLTKFRKHYKYGSFREVFPEIKEKIYDYSIYHKNYKKIGPLNSKPINLRNYIQHPIFFNNKRKHRFHECRQFKNG